MPEMKEGNDILDAHIARLMERFDDVLIIAMARNNDGTTSNWARGRGNYFARLGAARAFVVHEEAKIRRQGEKFEDLFEMGENEGDGEEERPA
jgi:hypothetical protein